MLRAPVDGFIENLTDQFIVAKPEGEGYQPLSALEYNTVKYSKFYNDKTGLPLLL